MRGSARAVGGEAVDVHGGAADHPVDVDEAFVGAEGGELFLGHFFAADEAGGVGLAERDVAGGVLVEEGVPEEDAGLRDGGVVRDEGDFAELARAFVGGDELVDGGFAGGGGGFDDLPSLKVQRMFSISVPWCESGLEAETWPLTRALCGVVKHSSVGMLALQ